MLKIDRAFDVVGHSRNVVDRALRVGEQNHLRRIHPAVLQLAVDAQQVQRRFSTTRPPNYPTGKILEIDAAITAPKEIGRPHAPVVFSLRLFDGARDYS